MRSMENRCEFLFMVVWRQNFFTCCTSGVEGKAILLTVDGFCCMCDDFDDADGWMAGAIRYSYSSSHSTQHTHVGLMSDIV